MKEHREYAQRLINSLDSLTRENEPDRIVSQPPDVQKKRWTCTMSLRSPLKGIKSDVWCCKTHERFFQS
ncbi:conserved hypothetical protein [Desulfonatronospira thiodismutans ASO3-1]|uniref:Uncharacterized protein n=1 Tax=Desulfonatronospira thiodismutans ASO3-1 TaxID=555779 RepID=D6SJY9_9BACT|nr:conserved hypothetical protein [Desulfonatronospira thiodismutans ASO3-1]